MINPAGVVAALHWDTVVADLEQFGLSDMGKVVDPTQCAELVALYDHDELFRSTVNMGQHRFGQGEYRYFAAPLPELVTQLRAAFWPHLLPVARDWAQRLGRTAPWPDTLEDWLAQCHNAGQNRPTPLLLRYGPGDWNALHRDLYGELVFPLQVIIGLDRPGQDYLGGELVVVEQRLRAQSRATTVAIGHGHAVVVTTAERPVAGGRGWTAAPMRHGVSVVRDGRRHTLGLLFHDAT